MLSVQHKTGLLAESESNYVFQWPSERTLLMRPPLLQPEIQQPQHQRFTWEQHRPAAAISQAASSCVCVCCMASNRFVCSAPKTRPLFSLSLGGGGAQESEQKVVLKGARVSEGSDSDAQSLALTSQLTAFGRTPTVSGWIWFFVFSKFNQSLVLHSNGLNFILSPQLSH